MKMDLKELLSKLTNDHFRVGDYQAISAFPWTAPCDAVIEGRVYPASAATSYMTFNISDGRVFSLTAYGGTALSGMTIVKKGTVLSNYQYNNLAPVASYLGYISLR